MRFLKLIRNFFPSALPIGITEFETWAEDIVSTYGFARSVELNRSYRWILASSMTTLGPTAAYKSKYYFFLVIQAASAKEIAGGTMYNIKQEQIAEQKAIREAAAAAQKLLEATTTPEASTSGQPQQ